MKIVVVSPHPDDETLGAGGFIIKHKQNDDKVYWINITDIVEGDVWSKDFVQHRREQIDKICKFYDFDGFYNLRYRPCSLENIKKDNLIENFGKCIDEIRPDWIVLPNPTDAHSDHYITYEIGIICSKIFRYPFVKRIMTMEILSETDFGKGEDAFKPNYIVDISEYIGKKIEALNIYDTEIGKPPFPRSIEAVRALALLRGSMAGCKFAEGFKMIKFIE